MYRRTQNDKIERFNKAFTSYRMKKILITLLVLSQVAMLVAQLPNQTYALSAKIVEENTNLPLPFVTVFNKTQLTGTASNPEGYFELPNNRIGDTIVVVFLGYQDYIFTITPELPKEIILSPHASSLNEIIVTGESDFLYALVSALRKDRKTKTKTSKTYFFLETQLYNEPIEIIEAYYNGRYSDHGIDSLKFKKGRIGLKPVHNRYYRSTESSSLFSLHDVFASSYLFPESPLAVSKKELKNNYTLTLSYTFEELQSKIYVVDIVPKDERTDLFGGTVWIDQQHNQLNKVSLRVKNASVHPFIPIGYNTIRKVDMEINKTYQTIDGDPFINSIDFNYNIAYVDTLGNEMKATTKAFTKAYDYDQRFKLPDFVFTRHLHEDYRNITAVPYDSLFWNLTTEFRFYDRLEEIETFITKHKIENSVIHPQSQRDSMHAQLQFPYILWSTNRFKMGRASDRAMEKSLNSKSFAIDKYNFNVKLYLDVNLIKDSLIYQLYAILDPVDSYYYFPIADIDLAYMNMYFDLIEIQRRALDSAIRKLPHPTTALLDELYQDHLKQFDTTLRSFISQTNRGKNLKKMEAWNDFIFAALGINNLEQFEVNGKR